MKNLFVPLSLAISFAFLAISIPGGEATEAVETSPATAAQIVDLNKPATPPEKQKNQAADQEAQTAPWANRLDNVTITYYCLCVDCCGKTDGITASGAKAVPHETCAVDPAVIPLGSDVSVDYGDGELHHYIANDVGGGVNGNHIDICVSGHEEALQLGRRTATVYWSAAEW